MDTTKKIRIVLAEDHNVVREGLRRLLEVEPDMVVVGEAVDGRVAVETVRRTKPDAVLMDLMMPQLNGIEATRQISKGPSSPRVIGLSMHREQALVGSMLRAGACGYLLKTCGSRELMDAIRTVVSGGTYLSPAVAGDVLDAYVRNGPEPSKSVFAELTDREREVLQLIAEGLRAKEIGGRLRIGQKTVLAHRARIMGKLDLHSDVDLSRYALQQGLTEL